MHRTRRTGTRLLLAVSLVSAGLLIAAAPAAAGSPGQLDTSFNGSGVAVDNLVSGGFDSATAVAVQPSGKVVVAGTAAGGGVDHFELARYTDAGVLDTTFGTAGHAVVPNFKSPSSGDIASGVAITSTGQIIVSGTGSDSSGNGCFGAARYTVDGSLDSSFGTNGQTCVTVGDPSFENDSAMTLEPNGDIVMVGNDFNGWAIARLTPNGALDTTFNGTGTKLFDLGDSFFDEALAVTTETVGPNTDILVGGAGAHNPAAGSGAGDEDLALVRLTDAGAFDGTFGTSGTVKTDLGGNVDQITALAVRSDGQIVAAGQSGNAGPSTLNLVVALYQANGTANSGFGSSGIASVSGVAADVPQRGLAVLADNSILVTATAPSNGEDLAIQKFTSTGHLDNAFGSSGVTTSDPSGGTVDEADALTLDNSGRAVVVGRSSVGSDPEFLVARYLDTATATVTGPADSTICGSMATFQVGVTSVGPSTVQWQRSTNGGGSWSNVSDGANVSGSTTRTLQLSGLTAADSGNQYRAVVTNGGGPTTSQAATLTIGSGPTVTASPGNQSVSDGASVSFTASATGTPAPTVQWFRSTDGGGSYSPIGGATSTTFTTTATTALSGARYRAVFTNTCTTATTTAATLTVQAVSAHELEVSEFRLAGPGGSSSHNWYVDVHNTTNAAVNMRGWALSVQTSPGTEATVALPAGTLPAGGTVLVTGNAYSLTAYAAADATSAIAADAGGGVAVVAPDGVTTDAAGVAGADAAVREGSGLVRPTVGAGELAFVRTHTSTDFTDTNNNAADFTLVATDAGSGTPGATFGAPGPLDLSAPMPNIAAATSTLLDTTKTATQAPNRVVTGSTMILRRTITNNTASTVHSVRLRILSITTVGDPVAADAQLEVQSSSTDDFGVGLTLNPPSGAAGGLNSTLTVPVGAGLAPGATVHVNLQFLIVRGGHFAVAWGPEVGP